MAERKITVLKLSEPSTDALITYYIVDPNLNKDDDDWLLGTVTLEDIGNLDGPSDWSWVVTDLQGSADDMLVGDGYYVEYSKAIATAVKHFAGIQDEHL